MLLPKSKEIYFTKSNINACIGKTKSNRMLEGSQDGIQSMTNKSIL